MSSPEIKVGDTLWLYEPYRNDTAKRWHEHVVTKITSQSYIVGEGFTETKVRKSDMTWLRQPGMRNRAFTAQGKAEHAWIEANRHRIAEAVRFAPFGLLKQIDDILSKGRSK